MSAPDQNICYDIAIVGSGPIGLETAVLARRAGLSVVQFDRGPVASTIQSYPDGTELFSLGERLAIGGVPFTTSNQRRPTRDQYLDYLTNICKFYSLKINAFESVNRISRSNGYFEITTELTNKRRSNIDWDGNRTGCQYKSKFIVLAIGDLHETRVLGIPGEELPHVHHRYKSPFCYAGSSVVVVGGRHSALGAALRLSSLNCEVTLIHRGSKIDKARTKAWIFIEFEKRVAEGSIRFLPSSELTRVEEGCVFVNNLIGGQTEKILPVNFVLPLIGYSQKKTLFQHLGVELLGPSQSPFFNNDTMETNVEGVFVAGTGVAGDQIGGAKLFIDNTHEHCKKIIDSISAEI